MRRRAFLFLAVALAAGCMEGQHPGPLPRNPSLYTQMGGSAKLKEVVSRFLALAGTAPEVREPIRAAFSGPGVVELNQKLARQLAAALGGPSPGTLEDLGKTLKSLPGEPTPADIEALLNVLDKAMQECDLGERTRKEILDALAPLKAAPEKPADKPDEPKD